jgi:hypothetical protein
MLDCGLLVPATNSRAHGLRRIVDEEMGAEVL